MGELENRIAAAIEDYRASVVSPLLGKGSVAYSLIHDLAPILNRYFGEETDQSEVDELTPSDMEAFDYDGFRAHFPYENPRALSRVEHAMHVAGVRSIQDLREKARSNIWRDKSNKKPWRALEVRNLGPSGHTLLYQYLKSMGIDLYEDGYTPTELGE